MQGKMKTLWIWLALVIAFVGLFTLTQDRSPKTHRDFDGFVQDVKQSLVGSIRYEENRIDVTLVSGETYFTLGVIDDELTQTLSTHGVTVEWGRAKNPWRKALFSILPIILLLGLFIYFLKKSGGQFNIMQLRKSRARVVTDPTDVTFDDVGGCDEAKAALGDIIAFLKNPEPWIETGARLPRGVLLEGAPGCGKTLLARAVAGESKAHFYSVSASEFVEMFVGVGSARMRDLFETAAKQTPAIIFIDELDAIGRRRVTGLGSNEEREHTLNQLLVSLDGFEQQDQIVVIAATNRADILDPALLRPGRFDQRIHIPGLTRDERLAILTIHTRNKPMAADVSLEHLADLTERLNTGAQLESLANDAALLAVRRSARDLQPSPLLQADDFVAALQAKQAHALPYTQVDAVMIESVMQLSEPTGKAAIRVTLTQGQVFEGDVCWADGAFIKLQQSHDASEWLLPKSQVLTVEPLADADRVDREALRTGLQPEGIVHIA